jgi:hypothetical protein
MGAMMFFMPAMQKNMDPEMAREMEAQQARRAHITMYSSSPRINITPFHVCRP